MQADGLAPGKLAAALARMTGQAVPEIEGLERLSGGANMESWAFAAHGAGYVLRRCPALAASARGISMAAEAALLRLAGAHGVKVPALTGMLAPEDGLGEGFIMARVRGTASPKPILAAGGEALAADCAAQLAAIHRLPTGRLNGLPHLETKAELARMRAAYLAQGGGRPVLALALRWLEEHAPPPAPQALVHGDFRMGNLMVEAGELVAVLDWELAHLGDPCRDIGWACINSWRFGRVERPALGLAGLEPFLAAYEAAGGAPVSAARLRFWMVFGSLNWALICLEMARIWRDGEDRTLERLVIGRRVSEAEADLLFLLQDDAQSGGFVKAPEAPRPQPALGEPGAAELLGAVAEWLRAQVKPALPERERFMASVALHALGIVERELRCQPERPDAALAARLLAGEVDLSTSGVLAALRRSSWARLAVDQPNYSALTKMRAEWEEDDAV